jgi:HD-GYP domain-containing protein (c-di-GMP phosphodiesterase class II)
VARSSSPRPRLAEVVAVLAMATDLGLGLPTEHAVRSCLLAVTLGRRVGMSQPRLGDLYYLTLLRMLGCTVASDYHAAIFGDEVAFGRDTQHLDYGDTAAFGGWVMQSFGADRPPEARARMIEKLFTYTPQRRQANILGHCEVARMLATRLRLTGPVVEGVGYAFERWDGTGVPYGVKGEQLPIEVRIMSLCNEVEVHHRLGGAQSAETMARQRSGAAFDPALVEVFCRERDSVLAVIDGPALWSDVLSVEPAPHRVLNPADLVEAARVMGDFADMKSRHFAGHASAVAGLAVAAADRLALGPDHRLALELGALAHDLGRVAVTTAIWDKPGPLNDSEWERVRLHAYYSERLLTKATATAAAGRIAGMHHERMDGAGYHRGARRGVQPIGARVLAAADAHVAMRNPRAHRPAMDLDTAGAALRRMAEGDHLDPVAVNAVLAAAGDTGPQVRRTWPVGLTDREVDVLRRVALGGSIQQTARDLHLAAKTVDFHLQNIYAKAGIGTRAAATLFAVQNDLLDV